MDISEISFAQLSSILSRTNPIDFLPSDEVPGKDAANNLGPVDLGDSTSGRIV